MRRENTINKVSYPELAAAVDWTLKIRILVAMSLRTWGSVTRGMLSTIRPVRSSMNTNELIKQSPITKQDHSVAFYLA